MKKSILIGALAALMLFAFVACDGGTASAADRTIVAISVTDGPTEYFGGETIDLDDYTVMATQVNGDTVPVEAKYLSLDEDKVTAPADNSAVEPGVIATVTYNGPFMATYGLQADITASVYKLDSLNVEAAETQATYYNGSSTKNLKDDYVVTAYAIYDDEVVFERELEADEYSVSAADSFIVADAFAKAGKAVLTFSTSYNSSATAIEDGSLTASVYVLNDYIESFEFVIGGDDATKEPIIDSTTTLNASDYVTVTYSMASGKTGNATETGATGVEVKWNAEVTAGTTTLEEGSTYTISVTAPLGAKGTESTQTKTVTLIPNYIASFKVTAATSTDVKGGYELTAEKVNISPVWKDTTVGAVSTVNDAVLKQNLRFVLSNGTEATSYTVPDNYPASTELPISFKLANYPEATTTSVISTTAAV